MKKLKVILIGAGDRGTTYTDVMATLPEQFQVVAVAEPVEDRRNHAKETHNIPDDMCFTDYKPLLALGKIADLAVIATLDRDHFEPAMMAIDLKYDLLLEKPIAPTPEECIALRDNAAKNGVRVVVCTVLRYTFMFCKLKELIDAGKIGDVVAINHEECVGFIHQSHSYVRGRWGNEKRSAPMLLAKSCHDIDILQWLLGKKCKKVQSFGSLSYFTRKNAPEGSPEYCIQGCPHSDICPYDAVKLYLENGSNWFRRSSTTLYNPTDDDVRKAISETQYGKCVYKCDNDVVDHQTVNMLFEDDINVTFNMNAFARDGRYINIMGTKGQIRAALANNTPISVFNVETKVTEEIECSGDNSILAGHGGGDTGIVKTLYYYMIGEYDGECVPTIEQSCYNHIIGFAAEKSRKENRVVDVEEFINNL